MTTLPVQTRDPQTCRARVVIIGDASTGKSSLLMRYVRDRFSEGSNSTIGIDFMAREVKAPKRSVQLQLWDVAGQERFRAVARSYYRNAAAAIVVCDINSLESFKSLPFWLSEFQEHNGNAEPINSEWGPPTLLLVNKVDRPDAEREVSQTDIEQFVAEQSIPAWFQVSAKSGFQVHAAFAELAKLLAVQLDAQDQNTDAILPGIERPPALGQTDAIKRLCC